MDQKKASSESHQQVSQQDYDPNSIPFTVATTLFFGFVAVSSFLIFIVSLLTAFLGVSIIIKYVIIAVFAILGGFFVNHAMKKINSKDSIDALFGIITPAFPLFLMIIFFTVIDILGKELTNFFGSATKTFAVLQAIINIFGTNLPDPIISVIVFFLFFNLFIIIRIFRTKKYYTFALYLLLPIIIFVFWIVLSILTSPILV